MLSTSADGIGIQHLSSGSAYPIIRPGAESEERQASAPYWSPFDQNARSTVPGPCSDGRIVTSMRLPSLGAVCMCRQRSSSSMVASNFQNGVSLRGLERSTTRSNECPALATTNENTQCFQDLLVPRMSGTHIHPHRSQSMSVGISEVARIHEIMVFNWVDVDRAAILASGVDHVVNWLAAVTRKREHHFARCTGRDRAAGRRGPLPLRPNIRQKMFTVCYWAFHPAWNGCCETSFPQSF
jgi:hypothetical protein